MARIRLIHWNASEAAPLIADLRSSGHDVDYTEKFDHRVFSEMRQSVPEAILIDLSRLPSHGREVAIAIRGIKAIRLVPIVFLGGSSEKVEAIRSRLPDAFYSDAGRVKSALRKALQDAPKSPVVPPQVMERYVSRSTCQKLGMAADSVVLLVDPPRDYAKVLGELPDGVTIAEDTEQDASVTLWFVRDPDTFVSSLPRMRKAAPSTKLWVVWPKRGSSWGGGLTQTLLRERAKDMGLVDYKICSVDETWSAMLFAKKKDRPS